MTAIGMFQMLLLLVVHFCAESSSMTAEPAGRKRAA
jgi:hypothetical protein